MTETTAHEIVMALNGIRTYLSFIAVSVTAIAINEIFFK